MKRLGKTMPGKATVSEAVRLGFKNIDETSNRRELLKPTRSAFLTLNATVF
jgi:hypothetical protein